MKRLCPKGVNNEKAMCDVICFGFCFLNTQIHIGLYVFESHKNNFLCYLQGCPNFPRVRIAMEIIRIGQSCFPCLE